jgi:hypothetical protein
MTLRHRCRPRLYRETRAADAAPLGRASTLDCDQSFVVMDLEGTPIQRPRVRGNRSYTVVACTGRLPEQSGLAMRS